MSVGGLPSTPSADSPASGVAYLLGADSPMSIGGTAWSSFADSPTSVVASLSDADSPMSCSSVTSHDSDVLDCLMEVSCVTATSGACKAMPWACTRYCLSANVRSMQKLFKPAHLLTLSSVNKR